MPPDPTAYWNFETLLTTGFEGDTDLVSGMVIGTNALGLDYPAASVAGKDGNGRLLASYNGLSFFRTGYSALLASGVTDPVSYSLWWRPLIEASPSGRRVLGVEFERTSSVPPGSSIFALPLIVTTGSADGLYDFELAGVTIATDVAMTYRDWNLICVAFEGSIDPGPVGTVNLYVNNVLLGSTETSTPAPESAGGRLMISKDLSGNTGFGSLIGVIDEFAFWSGHQLTAGDVTDIFNGWVYTP